MAVLAPPVQVVTSGAPPFVHVPSGAPPFVAAAGLAPPIMLVDSGAPPITLFNEDGSLWAGGGSAAVGGAALLTGETDGFATDFTYATDASRVAVKTAGATTSYALDAFYANAGTSPKQVYDVAGTLGWSPHNHCVQSENLQVSWTFVNGTATSATTFIPTTANGAHHAVTVNQVSAVGVQWTFSARVSAAGYTKVMLYDVGQATGYVSFDLTAGTILAQGATGTGTITALGGGQFALTLTTTMVGAGARFNIYVLPPAYTTGSPGIWIPDGVSGINIHRSQLNRGPVLTAYLPTTTAIRNGLALDYDPVTHAARGLLCEPAATNVLLRSSEFDNASWTKTLNTVTANATAALNGLIEADKLVDTTVSSSQIFMTIAIASTTGTLSIYAKAGELQHLVLFDQTANKGDAFNLITGAIYATTFTPTGAAVAQNVGNGWWRCSIAITASTSIRIYGHDGSGSVVRNGTAGNGIFLWGAQAETGTVATSPIPTFAASATRAADNYTVTPASINHSATAGSWWLETYPIAVNGTSAAIAYAGAAFPIYFNATGVFGLLDGTGLTKSTITSFYGAVHKVGVAFQSADRALTADGQAVTSDVGATTNLLSPGATIYCGSTASFATIRGYIRKVYYVPRRMTNPQLVTATT